MFVYLDESSFKNYLLGICKNKLFDVDDSTMETINVFSYIISLLENLKEKGVLIDYTETEMCDQFFKKFKRDLLTSFDNMNYFIKKFEKVMNEKADFYYFLTALNTMLGIDLTFDDCFLRNENNKHLIIYPKKVKVLAHVENTCSRRFIKDKDIDEDTLSKSGIYFIYGNDGKVDYIGKSASSAIRRSLESVKERGLYDFKKIEYRFTPPSNCGVYEAYYIAKYKPRCNVDMVYDDQTDIYIKNLKVDFVIDDKLYIDEEFLCSYIEPKSIPTELYLSNPTKYELCSLNAKGNREYLVNYYPKPLIQLSNTSIKLY